MTTSLDTFRSLAADHTVVPVWRELVADLTTPVAAYARLCGDGPGFLLESVEHGERWSRYSFIGRNPLVSITKRDGVVTVDGELPDGVTADDGVLAVEADLDVFAKARAVVVARRLRVADRLQPIKSQHVINRHRQFAAS